MPVSEPAFAGASAAIDLSAEGRSVGSAEGRRRRRRSPPLDALAQSGGHRDVAHRPGERAALRGDRHARGRGGSSAVGQHVRVLHRRLFRHRRGVPRAGPDRPQTSAPRSVRRPVRAPGPRPRRDRAVRRRGGILPALHSTWLVIHVAAAIISSGAFCFAGVLVAVDLVQERAERWPQAVDSGDFLPPSRSLDAITYRVIAFTFPLWTFAMIAGAIWAGTPGASTGAGTRRPGRSSRGHLRGLPARPATAGWRGRNAAFIALAGFAALTFNLFGVNLFITGLTPTPASDAAVLDLHARAPRPARRRGRGTVACSGPGCPPAHPGVRHLGADLRVPAVPAAQRVRADVDARARRITERMAEAEPAEDAATEAAEQLAPSPTSRDAAGLVRSRRLGRVRLALRRGARPRAAGIRSSAPRGGDSSIAALPPPPAVIADLGLRDRKPAGAARG